MAKYSFLNDIIHVLGIKWPGWSKFLLWSFGLAILVCLAFKEFSPLLQEYCSNNINTRVQVKNRQDNESFVPRLTLCIPRSFSLITDTIIKLSQNYENSSCEICEKMENHSWTVRKDLSPPDLDSSTLQFAVIRYQHNTLIEPIVKKLLLEDSDGFEVLSLTNFSWNQLIIDAVWDLFDCLLSYDRQFDLTTERYEHWWCTRNYEMVDFLLSNKTKVDILYYQFVQILCEYVHYKYLTKRAAFWPKDICVNAFLDDHSSIFYTSVCFSLPMDEAGLQVVVDPEGKNASWSSLIMDSHTYDNFLIFSHDGELFNSNNYLRSYYALYQSADMDETVNILYSVPFTVVEERDGVPCYAYPTHSECKNRCMVNVVVRMCNCTPFTFSTFVSGTELLSYCGVSHYANCKFSVDIATKYCNDQCNIPCRYVPYQWMVSKTPHRTQDQKGFMIKVKPAVSVHVEFHTTIKTSREVLLSQFGAIVNFYLGFTGLTVIACVSYFCKIFWHFVGKREVRPERQNSHEMKCAENIAKIGNQHFTDHLDRFIKQQEAWNELMRQKFEAMQAELNESLGQGSLGQGPRAKSL